MTYTVASFFSGIGGLDLAFAWAGFDIRFQCEIDDYCQQVLKKWRPVYWQNAVVKGDIHEVTKREVGKVDVIVGGFPCQDISSAGLRKGISKGTRSGLFFELFRLIRDIRPKVVFLENVAEIVRGDYPQGLAVIEALASIGYDSQWTVVPAYAVGSPQNRHRWFIVSYPNSNRRIHKLRNRKRKTQGKKRHKTVRRENGQQAIVGTDVPARSPHKITSRVAYKQSRVGRNAARVSKRMDRHTHEWVANRGSLPKQDEPEYLTEYTASSLARIKALGNAVVPQQAYPFAIAIKQFLEGVS